MFEFIQDLFLLFFGEKTAEIMAYIVLLLLAISVSLIARYIALKIVVRIIAKAAKKSKVNWDNTLVENKVFHRLANLLLPIILHSFSFAFPDNAPILKKIIYTLTIVFLVLVIDSTLNATDQIYRAYEISKARPIKGLLQVIKVAVFIIGGIILIATLVGESPMVLLGGIGAMTAVTSLIFKDAILGFVAGIQLSANDMVRIGDWIEMPQQAADGTVIDLSLTTVKVENFDKTITSIPAYALVSDAFINWRGMQNAGGRRIMRSINIDANSVKLCDDEMIERFKKIKLLSNYIDERSKEIEQYNKNNNFDLSVHVNGRRMTNLGVFRAYIGEYLKNNQSIRRDMIIMVRQLSATEMVFRYKYMPLQIQ